MRGEDLEIAVQHCVMESLRKLCGSGVSLDSPLGDGGAGFDKHSILDLYREIELKLAALEEPIHAELRKTLGFNPDETARALKRRIVTLIETGK